MIGKRVRQPHQTYSTIERAVRALDQPRRDDRAGRALCFGPGHVRLHGKREESHRGRPRKPVPAWNDGDVHGFVGCLAQESTDPGYFDLVRTKSDDGADVGTVRLTGHFLGIDDPKNSLNKPVHVTGVYLGREPTDPGSGHIQMTDDARPAEGKCP
jgi:hypothetical protein